MMVIIRGYCFMKLFFNGPSTFMIMCTTSDQMSAITNIDKSIKWC